MITIDFTSCVDKFYTYRSALVDSSVNIHLTPDDSNVLRNALKRCGYTMDNHICWTTKDGMCFSYSDHVLSIGTSLRECNW